MSKENKENKENIPNIEKDGWKAEEIAEEAANKEDDEIVRQMQIDEESEPGAERRDVAPPHYSNSNPGSSENSSNINKEEE